MAGLSGQISGQLDIWCITVCGTFYFCFCSVVIVFQGAWMICLLLLYRLAKLDESAEHAKGNLIN